MGKKLINNRMKFPKYFKSQEGKYGSSNSEQSTQKTHQSNMKDNQTKGVTYYTTAEEAYDGFGTETIRQTGYYDDRGRQVREVVIPESAIDWQTSRYRSGMRPAMTKAEFDNMISASVFYDKNPMEKQAEKQESREVEVVKSEIVTETNKAPLEEIKIQNASLENNSYVPASESCATIDTVSPASMKYDMFKAIETIDRRVNGVDEYVAEKLGYFGVNCSLEEKREGMKCLCDAFSAEQVDAIAVAIYNIEERGQGCIIGDQTGIGKGRTAAGVLRYAMNKGLKPIFLTEKPNLFSDLFRDIVNIGSDDGIPVQIVTGTKLVERKATKDEDEGEEDEVDDDTDDSAEDTEYEEIDILVKNKAYPSYTYTEFNDDGIEVTKTKHGKNFVAPFIINGASKKTAIKDESGNILYRGNSAEVGDVIGKMIKTDRVKEMKNGKPVYEKEYQAGTGIIPDKYKFILATYSQFNTGENSPKAKFLLEQAKGNIVVMDESHNASGKSNIGKFLKTVLDETKGVTFLSATFAKRPDNMPIYMGKTAMIGANMTSDQLVDAITRGGVALQEIVSSNLVAEGQMIRRERSFEGVEVNYKYLDNTQTELGYPNLDLEERHRVIMDTATDIIRELMKFQRDFVDPEIEAMDKQIKAMYKKAKKRKGTKSAGVDNTPIFSGVFNIVNQLLFSIKADAVADVAIQRLNQNIKPVIAFANTMESFLNTMTNDDGTPVREGDIINSDFSMILKKRLKMLLKYTEVDDEGVELVRFLEPSDLSPEFQFEYQRLLTKIAETSVGICSSPIDVLVDRINKAGFTTAEVTGRGLQLRLMGNDRAQIKSRVKTDAKDAFRKFNNNQVDCLLINQSGSTGASAHALPNKKVSKENVRQRCLIFLQAELNINTQVQKMGRINRTGQIFKPIYDYVISAIPAEKRLMMMLQKKLASLDANTTSSQDTNIELLDPKQVDFLNKYGDEIVVQYLRENPLINELIGDPLKLAELKDGETPVIVDAAHRASGRVAILSIKDQEAFYNEIGQRYVAAVQYLIETDEYDLKVKPMDFKAETVSREIAIVGKGGDSMFGRNSILEKLRVNNLRKPYKKEEVEQALKATLGDYTPETLRQHHIEKFTMFMDNRLQEDIADIESHYAIIEEGIYTERAVVKIKDAAERSLIINMRKVQIEEARALSIEKVRTVTQNKKQMILSLLRRFIVGKVCFYPSITYSVDGESYKAIFLGFHISEDLKNPYAPSAIKLRFAIAGSLRYIAVPASKFDVVNAIIAASTNVTYDDQQSTLENWDNIIKEKMGDRTTRFVVTGNILQAYGQEKLRGSLISYTTINGGVKKGILLPEGFDPMGKAGSDDKMMMIVVPILTALPIIKGLTKGNSLTTNDQFGIVRAENDFMIVVPLAKTGSKFYKDETILELTLQKDFNSSADKMKANVPLDKITELVVYLQETFGCNVALKPTQFDLIKGNIVDEEYADEEVIPKEKVIIEKLTEETTQEEQRRKAEEEAKALEDTMKEGEAQDMAEQEKELLEKQKEQDMAAMMKEKKTIAFKKKLINFYRLLSGKNVTSMANGGGVDAPNKRDLYFKIKEYLDANHFKYEFHLGDGSVGSFRGDDRSFDLKNAKEIESFAEKGRINVSFSDHSNKWVIYLPLGKFENGGELEIGYKVVAFPEHQDYKYYVVEEEGDFYVAVNEEKIEHWKNANKFERHDFYEEVLPKSDVIEIETMAKGGKFDSKKLDKYLSSHSEMFQEGKGKILTKKDLSEFLNASKDSPSKFWIKNLDGYSYYAYKGQLKNNNSTSGIFSATNASIDKFPDSLTFKIEDEGELSSYEKERDPSIVRTGWEAIVDKFNDIFFLEGDKSSAYKSNVISSDQVKAEEYKMMFDRVSSYPSALSWESAIDKFKASLSKKELDGITIKRTKEMYADAEEHDQEKYHRQIYVTRKEGHKFAKGGDLQSSSINAIVTFSYRRRTCSTC
jgi:energy-coupling factor transporter ATP-binding protein EcfA2